MSTAPAQSAGRVRREGDRTVIAGFDRLDWPAGQENSTVRCLTLALRAMGATTTYDRLMGASGLAFRIQFHQPTWCPGSPHCRAGSNCSRRLGDAVDFALTPHHADTGDAEGRRRVRSAVAASIDAGRPVIYQHYEDGLIVGHQRDGEVLLGRTYPGRGGPRTDPGIRPISEWPPFPFLLPHRKPEPIDRRGSAAEALRWAVAMWNTPRVDADRAKGTFYAGGPAAWAAWIHDLRDNGRFESADPAARRSDQHANAFIFFSLIDARTRAAGYLRSVAPMFEGSAGRKLRAASELYHRLLVECLCRACPTEVAPAPWMPTGRTWTPTMRHHQANILEEAAELDARAIATIAEAVEGIV